MSSYKEYELNYKSPGSKSGFSLKRIKSCQILYWERKIKQPNRNKNIKASKGLTTIKMIKERINSNKKKLSRHGFWFAEFFIIFLFWGS